MQRNGLKELEKLGVAVEEEKPVPPCQPCVPLGNSY
jgi:hypothetical protein